MPNALFVRTWNLPINSGSWSCFARDHVVLTSQPKASILLLTNWNRLMYKFCIVFLYCNLQFRHNYTETDMTIYINHDDSVPHQCDDFYIFSIFTNNLRRKEIETIENGKYQIIYSKAYMRFLNLTRVTCILDYDSKLIREIIYNLKPGVHIIATIATIAQKNSAIRTIVWKPCAQRS